MTVSIETAAGTKSYELRRGLGLLALEKHRDLPIEFDCREADCGICIVTVLAGLEQLSNPTPAERDFLKAMRAEPNERLACQCRVMGDVTLAVDDA